MTPEDPIPNDLRDTTNDALDTFADGGDFDLAWRAAQQAEYRPSTSRAIAIALPVAAAAVLALVAWTALPAGLFTPEPDVASGAGAVARDDGSDPVPDDVDVHPDADIVVGAGHLALYAPKQPVASIDIVLPDVLTVQTTGRNGALSFHGLRPGRTDVVLQLEGVDTPTILSAEVTVDPISPDSDETLAVEAGTYEILELDHTPTAITVVDPDILGIQAYGLARRFALNGLRPGTTDLLIHTPEGRTIYTVHVGVDPTAALASPPAEQILYTGQAVTVPLDGADTVNISDPDVIASRPGGKTHIVLSGLRPGRSDVLLTGPNGNRHLRFDVRP